MMYDPNLLWLIQKNQEDRHAILEVQDILDELGVRWIEFDIDFKSRLLPLPVGIKAEDIVICHGPSFIPRVEHSEPFWRVGCIFDPSLFRWSEFQRHWTDLMLSSDGTLATVRQLRTRSLVKTVFVRPDADSKKFDGGIRSPEELTNLLMILPDDIGVVSASPLEIEAEYRVFIIGSEVVAASQYRKNGSAALDGFIPNQVIDLAIEADTRWRPKEAYVLDIAKSGSRYGIIEANCITAARYYNGNPRAIVTGLCRLYGSKR
jgi:hypothetical protein